MTSINEEVCESNLPEEVTKGSRIFHQIYFATLVLVIVVTLVLWYHMRKTHIYLMKRSFSALIINAMAQIALSFTGTFPRMFKDGINKENYCPVHNISITAFVPFLAASILASTLSFQYRAKLSLALADSPENVSYWKWFKASGKFSALFMITTLTAILFVSLIPALVNCPIGRNKDCKFLGISDLQVVIVSLGLGLVMAIIVVRLQRQLRTFPDPFRLLSEFKIAVFGGLLFGSILTILDIASLFNFPEDKFDFGQSVDFAVNFIFIWLGPVQLYKANKFNEKKVFGEQYSLERVLADPTGRQLLTQHLKTEFSVENIRFLEDIEEYKTEEDEGAREELGKKIYEIYIRHKFMNISHGAYAKLEVALEESGYTKNVFDVVYRLVQNLIEDDSFLRFVNSEQFQLYVGLQASAKTMSNLL